jgi:hypothetical protein
MEDRRQPDNKTIKLTNYQNPANWAYESAFLVVGHSVFILLAYRMLAR